MRASTLQRIVSVSFNWLAYTYNHKVKSNGGVNDGKHNKHKYENAMKDPTNNLYVLHASAKDRMDAPHT